MRKLLLVAVICFFSTLIGTAQTVYYVKTSENGGNDSNNGLSWSTAFASVQKAIDAANSAATTDTPNEVWVAKGTYYPTKDADGNISDNPRNHSITIKDKVKVFGGFTGNEHSVNQRAISKSNTHCANEYTNETIFSGNFNKDTQKENNSLCVVVFKDISKSGNSEINGITVCEGFKQGGENLRGAGVYAEANAKIIDCIIEKCYITSDKNDIHGGGIFMESSELKHSTIRECGVKLRQTGGGGGVTAFEGSVIDRCYIYSCYVRSEFGSYGEGGGAKMYNSSISNSRIFNCTSGDQYGGFRCGMTGGLKASENSKVNNCIIHNNSSLISGGLSGSRNVHNTVIACNKSYRDEYYKYGTGVVNSYLYNCIVWNNYNINRKFLRQIGGYDKKVIYTAVDQYAHGEHVIDLESDNTPNGSGNFVCFKNPPTIYGTASTPEEFNQIMNADFSLMHNSSCIGKGSNKYTENIPLDYSGNKRVRGTVDQGAFEFFKKINLTGLVANNKIYDGTNSASVNTQNAILSGVIEGDDVSINANAPFVYSDKNVGDNKLITITDGLLTGDDNAKYEAEITTLRSSITKKQMTVSGIEINDKTYDGDNEATYNTNSITYNGKISGDNININFNNLRLYFQNKNVGQHTLTSSGNYAIEGTDAGNYNVNVTIPQNASINKKTITPKGLVTEKQYDGTNDATVNYNNVEFDGLVTGDNVRLNGNTVELIYSDSNVGNNKNITVSSGNFTLEGNDASNYHLSNFDISGNIIKREIVVSGLKLEKEYDGTTACSINTDNMIINGMVTGENVDVDFSNANIKFNSKNAGNNLTYTWDNSNIELQGDDSENYMVSSYNFSSKTITPKPITVSGIVIEDKIYDNNTSATGNYENTSFQGIIDGDDIALNYNGIILDFDNKNAGNNKSVTANKEYSISGKDASNYTLSQPEDLTGNILKKDLLISGVKADNKVYDGTTAATLNTENIVIETWSADEIILNTTDAYINFDNKNVGNNISITAKGLSLDGKGKDNYNLLPLESLSANITPKSLVYKSSITADNKVYDGTTKATISIEPSTPEGIAENDNVEIDFSGISAEFASKNVGNDIQIKTTGDYSLTGDDALNYTLPVMPEVSAANITPRPVTVANLEVTSKVYDGTTTATINYDNAVLTNVVDGDNISFNNPTDVNFTDKRVEDNKSVIFTTPIALSGNDANNYSLSEVDVKGNITAKEVTLDDIAIENKVYDGTTSATLNASAITFNGVIDGETLNLNSDNVICSFDTKSAGENKTVSISGNFELTGNEFSDNYSLAQPTTSFSANISKKSLNVNGIKANSKVEDGTNTAELNIDEVTFPELVDGDNVNLDITNITATFDQTEPGENIAVTVNGEFGITGTDAINYSLSQPTLSLTANISKVTAITDNIEQFNVFPNPTTDKVSVSGLIKGCKLTLCNTAGKPVLNKSVNSEITEIELTDLVAGVYFLVVNNESSKKHYKIIKK